MEPTYLGDGVYASFDGYHIWLHVGDHRNKAVVALEPAVIESLNRYYEKTKLVNENETDSRRSPNLPQT